MIKLGCDESLPSKWRWVEANNVMDVRDGTHDSPKAVDEGIPLVTSKNLVGGKIDFSTCNLISMEDHEAISKRSSVDDGDILYAMIGTIGNPVIVEKSREFSIKNVALFKFTKSTEVYNRYIYHFLNSNLAIRQFQSNSRGGTQKFVSLGNIRSLQIPLPPLDEQKRIAAILDKADAIRRKRQQAIDLADDFLRSVFLDMFDDPMFGNKYERKQFSEFASLQQGLQIPISKRKTESGTDRHKYLTVKYLNGKGHDEYIESPRKSVIVSKKQVLMTRTGNTGQVITDVEGVFHNNFFRIDFDESLIDKSYLVNFLTFPKIKAHLVRLASTTTIPDLNHSEFLAVSLQIPPMEAQKKFSEIVNRVKKAKDKLLKSLSSNEDAFNSLSQKAFSGEL